MLFADKLGMPKKIKDFTDLFRIIDKVAQVEISYIA